MKFTTLKIENFLAITEATLRLNDRGLVLIQGENLDDTSADSNGAGKSSIPDALCWVLYGVTARDVSGDDVINFTAGKGTKVQIDIEDGDEIYRIARHRKHPKGKNGLTVLTLDKSGKITDLTKGTDKLTQEMVTKIIGASHEVFKGAIYAGQEQMPDLPAMTDKHLKVLIEEASGVTLLEEAYKEARTRVAQAKSEHDAIGHTIDAMKSKKEFLEDEVVTTTAARDSWKLSQQTQIAAMKAEISTRIQSVKDFDVEIAKIDAVAIDAGIAECDVKLAALAGETAQQRKLGSVVVAARGEVGRHRSEVLRLKALHDKQKKAVEEIQHKIGCPCDECGREMTEAELGAAKAAAIKKANEIVREFKEAKDKLETAEKSTQEHEGALQRFEATMTDPSAISAQRASLTSQRDVLNELQRKRGIEATKAKAGGDHIKTLAATANPHEPKIGELEKKIADLDRQIKDLETKYQAAGDDVAVAESVAKVFSPAGVRAHILDEVTPFLNQQTSKYLSILSDGNIDATWTTLVKNAKGELREKFSIEVSNDKGGKTFKALSGGEKRKVRVATALALQDLVATRASKPIDLFVGDEIDHALDQAGLERLTQILEEKAGERGSVFVISHNSLRDWVSQIITVRKKDEQTTLVEETV